jgi:hypothetical protein
MSALFAALNVLDGKVIGQCMSRRHQEFIRFLNTIDRQTTAAQDVHLIVDATHKHPKVRAWLARHQRFQFHFTPTSAPWLDATNDDPKPFAWTADPDAIIKKVRCGKLVLKSIHQHVPVSVYCTNPRERGAILPFILLLLIITSCPPIIPYFVTAKLNSALLSKCTIYVR